MVTMTLMATLAQKLVVLCVAYLGQSLGLLLEDYLEEECLFDKLPESAIDCLQAWIGMLRL